MSYKDLRVYQLALKLELDVQAKSKELPKHELYELGSQIRRASQSVRANIVEGYGRRMYKLDYILFLHRSNASLMELESHFSVLKVIYPDIVFNELIDQANILGRQIYRYIEYVIKHHRT
jgi:four helix bundle protein